jgi:hypothetical protein
MAIGGAVSINAKITFELKFITFVSQLLVLRKKATPTAITGTTAVSN